MTAAHQHCSAFQCLHEYAGVPLRALAADDAIDAFVNDHQGYSLRLPIGFRAKSKAGADALFENPKVTSTNIGITVAPVRIANLDAFGDINTVTDKLLAIEKAKVRAHIAACTLH